jgi:hypothetical protein
MKKPVADAYVAEYTKRLRAGGPVGAVLPYPLSECDLTEVQKLLIKEARKARKQLEKKSKPQPPKPLQPTLKPVALKPTSPSPPPKGKSAVPKPTAPAHAPRSKSQSLSMLEQMLFPAVPKTAIPKPAVPKPVAPKPAPPAIATAPKPQSLTRLERMLYLQQGKCFFCGEQLALEDANIEHLNPLSLGGKSTPDNLVVCHKSLNDTFGDLPLKQKFKFVLEAAGSFRCPKK